MAADNILSRLRGEDVGRAVLLLPPIETTVSDTVSAVIDAPGIGRARITYRKFRKSHGRSRLLFWLAESAERIE